MTVPTDSFYYQKRWIGLLVIGISVIVISLDNTILNVTLPSIARDLNAGTTELQWIVDGYVLVFAALLLTMGTLGDRIGRKRALQIGLGLFMVGSLAAALAPTTAVLIGARMFLGVAGALMLPATLSIVSATFQPAERPQAIATWASLFALGVGAGPVLGGFLSQTFGWHAVFLVNVPVIAAALVLGQVYLGETREPNAPPPDVVGSLLSIVGLMALIYGIIEAGVLGWTDPTVIAALVGAVVVLSAFALWEARTPYPMLPLRFFRIPAFTGANVTLTLLTFALFGAVFFVPQFLQAVLGYEPFVAGLMILPLALTLTIVTNRSAQVAARLGTKRTVVVGMTLTGIAFLYQSVAYKAGISYFPLVFIGQIVQATGLGLAISPATNAIMSAIPISKAGVGSAMNDTTRQLGGALGIAVLGTIATSIYLAQIAPLRERLSPEAYTAFAAGLPSALSERVQALVPAAEQAAVNTLAREAFMAGMNQAFVVAAVIMFGAALFAWFALPDVVQRKRDTIADEGVPAVSVSASGED